MGVPAFYRWLSQRYPKTVVDCIEEEMVEVNGTQIPVDTSTPNPNGFEFDNLYLDMNGIIHPCFHPEDRPAPTTEVEVFNNIFDYIDRLFGIVRPRKLLYMAIDGVAPRAKMNQQRSRRFRSAQEAEEKRKLEEQTREEWRKEGIKVPEKDDKDTWDSNTITPGTPFMARLAVALQYYVHKRLNEDPGWKGVKVILSDSNVPGEGEHKIMAYIREQRDRDGWDPNTRHCIYGLDADLIMLGLATHEPHTVILREVVLQTVRNDPRSDSRPPAMVAGGAAGEEAAKPEIAKKPYQFLMVKLLREYLALEFQEIRSEVNFAWDVERIFDDFVFMCFFVGNDFLPHMPTLEIREGSIPLMFHIYRQVLPELDGYLCNGAHVNLPRVQRFIEAVAQHEEAIFCKRMKTLFRQRNRRRSEKAAQAARNNGTTPPATLPRPDSLHSRPGSLPTRSPQSAPPPLHAGSATASNKSAALALRKQLLGNKRGRDAPAEGGSQKKDKAELGTEVRRVEDAGNKRGRDAPAEGGSPKKAKTEPGSEVAEAPKLVEGLAAGGLDSGGAQAYGSAVQDAGGGEEEAEATPADAEDAEAKAVANSFKEHMQGLMRDKADCFDTMVVAEEKIRLGEDGWKDRYYTEKLGLQGEQQAEVVRDMVKCYVEGLCWVMAYYYDGVASWRWFYPYHYAPFASDLTGLDQMQISFTLGQPFLPFNQLLSVLPSASAHALPECLRPLTQDGSPIIDFYPKDFSVDMNGKRFAWQGVALLPFIDEERLFEAVEPLLVHLNEEERRRNSQRLDVIYMRHDHPLGPTLFQVKAEFDSNKAADPEAHQVAVDPAVSPHMNGFLAMCENASPSVIRAPMSGLGEDIQGNRVISATYLLPRPHRPHRCKIPSGTVLERPELTERDKPHRESLWHEQHGRGGGPPPPQQQQHQQHRYGPRQSGPPQQGLLAPLPARHPASLPGTAPGLLMPPASHASGWQPAAAPMRPVPAAPPPAMWSLHGSAGAYHPAVVPGPQPMVAPGYQPAAPMLPGAPPATLAVGMLPQPPPYQQQYVAPGPHQGLLMMQGAAPVQQLGYAAPPPQVVSFHHALRPVAPQYLPPPQPGPTYLQPGGTAGSSNPYAPLMRPSRDPRRH